ncbi:MAG: IPT/TIG domain-containing protein [Treponema sp.]|nr:IPT/TIG domain-containing protein [Treponema sp.]
MAGKLFKPIPSIILVSVFFFSCSPKAPVITSISPRIGRMGDVITLTGSNFGELREESYITIAGIAPTNSSYHLWQDNFIMVRIPEHGDSGLIHVHTRGKKSNGILFSNLNSMPRPVDGEAAGIAPRITSISPQTGAPGTLITITGSNFGVSRENGGVFFSWDYEAFSFNPFAVREQEFIEVSETELGYVSWNTREIQIRIPDGAASGNIEVRTPNGSSSPFSFNVSGKPGNKIFKDKRSYMINYSVDIRVNEATRPNALYLWIPVPVTSPSQHNVSLISRSAEPFIENFRGASLHKLDNLGTGTNNSINHSFRVDVYAVETEINPQSVRQQTTPLSAMYTQSSELIPSDNQQIRTTVNTIIGREQNPFVKARLLYNWIIANIQIADNIPSFSNNIPGAITAKQANPYAAAMLYTTMARAAGVPCVPVAGVLINNNGSTKQHYWAEIWINDFGWVPVDPVMGKGAAGVSFITKENPAEYYFGNLDNQRIAFSRGERVLSQMESRGRPVSRNQSYSLQNIWEEASGGLESYTSLWGDIIISGVYAQ